ncbi:trehalose-phosphatase [Aureimonas altamirensis]|uniref:trehalose-phosphatase n=1 Tax=Aureimonas altamirensis TaxID=370622 RepID=UPI002036A9EB|nr:trehalose-phosphatase [Aureimonas altamirensis]MCM2505924.1 trehalose-phosphatase [Aureimonas altamirensis]
MQARTQIDFSRHALFLDFDGTLVDFVDDPSAVSIRSGTLRSLMALQAALSGALAIVSGRRIADLDRFLSPLEFAAAGVHGLELRSGPGAPVERIARPEDMDPIRAALAEGVAGDADLRLEDKGTALVLHYRTAPHRRQDAERLMDDAVSGVSGLKVMRGNNIVEVHPAGMDKGAALRRLMQAAPFAGRKPIYIGDDTTDEFAFAVVPELDGAGIKVGQGATAATERLADVSAVERWLAEAGERT